ncbi:unnamed protein product [Rotaria magnacalcarata]|uniref:Uncharacterized protein n=2 Tax=Rotaria magnacalcarata TaxID=392030 RepID=A0A816B689_9BILA|nr:unnamed protein product [Rotaria magnacalcarata]
MGKKQRQLQKQQKEEEKQRKIQAEKKREQDQRLALLRAANDENSKKLDEQARKQREREAEMDKKLQEPRETLRVPSTAPVRRRPPPNQADKDKTDIPRTVNDRPSNQHSGESSSSTFWKLKTHPTYETRDSPRIGPNTLDQWRQPDDSNNWRT